MAAFAFLVIALLIAIDIQQKGRNEAWTEVKKMPDTKNPCDCCPRTRHCSICFFGDTGGQSGCSNHDCFLNHEGTCLVSAYENCGARRK